MKNKENITNKYYYSHIYDVNIIDIYNKIVSKINSLPKYKSDYYQNIISKYKAIIKHLIEFDGYNSNFFFKMNLPYVLYQSDVSFDLFLALKLIYEESYYIKSILNYHYQISIDKNLFVNRLEFYTVENIHNNLCIKNDNILKLIFEWIDKKRNVDNIKYIRTENNKQNLDFQKMKNKYKEKGYNLPINIKNLKENEFFNLFTKVSHFQRYNKY